MYYKNKNNELYFEPSKEVISRDGLMEITEVEFNELLVIQDTPTLEQELQAKIAEAKQYLASTGWYVERLNDPSSGKAIPEDVLLKRTEAREFIRVQG